jgi:hypothetical protein
MNEDDFASAVRKGEGSFAVTKITLRAGSSVIRGKGRLIIVEDGFEIDDFIVSPHSVTRQDGIVWNTDNFWSLTDFVGEDLKFRSQTVTPSGQRESWRAGRKPRLFQKLHLGPIELSPRAFRPARGGSLSNAREIQSPMRLF